MKPKNSKQKPAISVRTRQRLIDASMDVRQRAYAPYSKYHVGAALLGANGKIHTGCNVENASYGLTICAERGAIMAAVGSGTRDFRAIAVATDNGGSPCGACRQVLAEFGLDLIVYLVDKNGNAIDTTLRDLLPLAFTPEKLYL
jgi:cytidine deaminase